MKPKFKVGDIISGTSLWNDLKAAKIIGIADGHYLLENHPERWSKHQPIYGVDENCVFATKLEKALK